MPDLHIKLSDFSFDRKLFKEILNLGLTMGFMLSIVSIGNLIMQSAINDLGENVITSHLLARKVDSLFMIPFFKTYKTL